MMTAEEQERLDALQRDWITGQEAMALVGVDPFDPSFEGMLIAYGQTLRGGRWPFKEDKVSRYLLESFLLDQRLISVPNAGARLGMTAASLLTVVSALEDKGLVPAGRRELANTISLDLIESLHRRLPGTERAQTFSNQSDYCAKVHAALVGMGIAVEPLYCETSRFLGEQPMKLAYDFCRISQQPTSLANRVYMNFGKPLRLPPDVCSRLFFFKHQDELGGFLFGAAPQLVDLAAAA
jgi:hypothetical protein